MNVEKIKQLLLENNRVEFKLYSLDYVIENKDGITLLYATTYRKDIRKYNIIYVLINRFTVYYET